MRTYNEYWVFNWGTKIQILFKFLIVIWIYFSFLFLNLCWLSTLRRKLVMNNWVLSIRINNLSGAKCYRPGVGTRIRTTDQTFCMCTFLILSDTIYFPQSHSYSIPYYYDLEFWRLLLLLKTRVTGAIRTSLQNKTSRILLTWFKLITISFFSLYISRFLKFYKF